MLARLRDTSTLTVYGTGYRVQRGGGGGYHVGSECGYHIEFSKKKNCNSLFLD